ncbi:MAG: 1-acyl-sn-glycerol-3-phosphate acyltransferase [Myxococcota bacterium]|nr:1-acyl-sn-glycerol-3-phosphate acyltransferase [Myxococcota bacterium]
MQPQPLPPETTPPRRDAETSAGHESPQPTRADAVLHAPYEPGRLLRWLYARFFSHIRVEPEWERALREAHARGVVVYVMRSLSFLDFLCLDFLLKRLALPALRFCNDLGLWILEPFGKGRRRLAFRRQIPEAQALCEVVADGGSALLFLRRPPRFGQAPRKGRRMQSDLLAALVGMQRSLDRPILLLPQTFVWSKFPPSRRRTLWDLLFGPREWPGKIRVFFQFLLNYRHAVLRSGDPIDLRALVHAEASLTDAQLADRLRMALLRRIERERTVVLGPARKEPARLCEEILRSPRLRRHLEAHARATGTTVERARALARRELRRMAAAQDPAWLAWMQRLLDRVWNRIYDGIEVDREGLERVRAAARDGPLVFLPSHKSHIDYLVLSDVLYRHGLSPPLVAAGDNLSFWPLGPVLRRGGAFFIRRSFKGRKLYSALVDAYVRRLLHEGHHLELFFEGGRSRTGKLLPPKLGLLSMIVDACLALPDRRIAFVPVSIGYERIVEERSYLHEAAGGDKRPENLGGLLRAPRLLRSRYGRLHVRFGRILPFAALLDEVRAERTTAGRDPDVELSPPERRTLVQRLGHRVAWEINRVTVVTPSALLATALLLPRRRGITWSDQVALCPRLADELVGLGAPMASALDGGRVRPEVLAEAVELFLDGKLLVRHGRGEHAVFEVPEERRLAVEYYKNNTLHFFVAHALVAAAVGAGRSRAEPATEHAVRERVRMLSRLYKYEFSYRADASFDEIFDEALGGLLARGWLERRADRLATPAEAAPSLALYASLLQTYFESYAIAARACEALFARPMSRKEWLRHALSLGERTYLAGEIALRESVSRHRLENALLAFDGLGLVRAGDDGQVRLADDVADPEAFRTLDTTLRALCGD